MRFTKWLLAKFQRFVGFEKVTEVRIASWVVDDLCEMARSAHPKEMLAFLSADTKIENGALLIDSIQLQAYHASIESANVNLWQLPTHSGIVGTVHSHPGPANRPSRADLRLFSQFGLVHAIIGKPYRSQDIRWMDKGGGRIDVRIVHITQEEERDALEGP